MDASTGERLGLLEGGAVTARRTAALSLLAARELAPRPDGPLLVVGAGRRDAPTSTRSARASASRRPTSLPAARESAVSLAGHARGLGMEAEAVEGPGEVLADVSLVVTATTSREPVLREEIPEGIFVAAVGRFPARGGRVASGFDLRSRSSWTRWKGRRRKLGT